MMPRGMRRDEGSRMSFTIDPGLLGLVDNVALVTGGGGVGMGRAHCVQLARAGCHVLVADVDEAGGRETVRQVEALGRKAAFARTDTTSRGEVERMTATALSSFGRLDVAVNHVGGTGGIRPFLDFPEDVWDKVIALNLKGTFHCCQVEGLAMIEQGVAGRIINVASSSGIVGAPNIAAYGASKAAVIHLTKTLAMEYGRYGIRVNCIVPGTHDNERTVAQMQDPNYPENQKEFRRAAAKAPPLGRLGMPMETAGLAVFFASALSSYVTGVALLSDGGVTLTTNRPPVGMELVPEAVRRVMQKKGKAKGMSR